MAFAEVVPALNNGVVDCGVTGSLSGNTAGWAEVTRSIYPMSLGWSINVLAVNLNSWNRMDARTQAFFQEQVRAYEDKMWETLRQATEQADNCNTGRQPCTMGRPANMTIVPVKPEEQAAHRRLVEGAVLANWARRCGAECAREWNETVGRTLGLTAPVRGHPRGPGANPGAPPASDGRPHARDARRRRSRRPRRPLVRRRAHPARRRADRRGRGAAQIVLRLDRRGG
jgi:hypothetical protein